jgi:thiamine pyrophosphokinase
VSRHKEAVIFTSGRYRAADFSFYRLLCENRFGVAADGGFLFFKKANVRCDLVVGDFDSLKRVPTDVATLVFDKRKDKTDTQLALEHCLKNGYTRIDIVDPSIGEPDHFLGNLMLLTLALIKKAGAAVRLVSPECEIVLIEDSSVTFEDCAGDRISVIPLGSRIRLSCNGTAYDIENAPISRGSTHGLRNEIVKSKAEVGVLGSALVVHSRAASGGS